MTRTHAFFLPLFLLASCVDQGRSLAPALEGADLGTEDAGDQDAGPDDLGPNVSRCGVGLEPITVSPGPSPSYIDVSDIGLDGLVRGESIEISFGLTATEAGMHGVQVSSACNGAWSLDAASAALQPGEVANWILRYEALAESRCVLEVMTPSGRREIVAEARVGPPVRCELDASIFEIPREPRSRRRMNCENVSPVPVDVELASFEQRPGIRLGLPSQQKVRLEPGEVASYELELCPVDYGLFLISRSQNGPEPFLSGEVVGPRLEVPNPAIIVYEGGPQRPTTNRLLLRNTGFEDVQIRGFDTGFESPVDFPDADPFVIAPAGGQAFVTLAVTPPPFRANVDPVIALDWGVAWNGPNFLGRLLARPEIQPVNGPSCLVDLRVPESLDLGPVSAGEPASFSFSVANDGARACPLGLNAPFLGMMDLKRLPVPAGEVAYFRVDFETQGLGSLERGFVQLYDLSRVEVLRSIPSSVLTSERGASYELFERVPQLPDCLDGPQGPSFEVRPREGSWNGLSGPSLTVNREGSGFWASPEGCERLNGFARILLPDGLSTEIPLGFGPRRSCGEQPSPSRVRERLVAGPDRAEDTLVLIDDSPSMALGFAERAREGLEAFARRMVERRARGRLFITPFTRRSDGLVEVDYVDAAEAVRLPEAFDGSAIESLPEEPESSVSEQEARLIIISDEDERIRSVQQTVAFIEEVVGPFGAPPFLVSGGVQGCRLEASGRRAEASPSPVLTQAVRALNGRSTSICEPGWPEDWSEPYAAQAALRPERFRLQDEPVRSSLVLLLDGEALPEVGADGSNQWFLEGQDIRFPPGRGPLRSAVLVAEYEVQCRSRR
ncbi:MAG: hypothetical protein AAGD10_16170 [Myxococcota bacterium]